MRTFISRTALRAGVVVVLLASAAGIAYATIPGSGGLYTACLLNNVGTIRLIDPSLPASNLMSHCTSLETKITFNQQGPQGLPGLPGAPGTNGKDGQSVTTATEPPGANCANGGASFTAANGTTFACNGAAGAPGKDGAAPSVTQLVPGDANCSSGGAAITDAAGHTADVCNGANGQPFSGTFTSPNGEFSVAVQDTGITLTGPNASVSLTAAGVGLTGGTIGLTSGATLELSAPFLGLNPPGCAPALREIDLLTAVAPPFGGPLIGLGSGSSTVCIG